MSTDAQNRAQALLDAHVAFTIAEVTGDGFPDLVRSHLNAFLDDVQDMKLGDVVDADQVRATAHKYAVRMEISGAIPELVGDIARRIYDHPAHDEARLNELVSDEQFNEWVDKALEMRSLRERIIHEVVSNPVYEALISDITYYGISGYISENPLTRNVPGAQSMMKLGKSMMSKAGPGLEKGLKSYIRKNLKPLLRESENFLKQRIDEERIAEAARDIWDNVKDSEVAMFREYVSKRDVEEIFVIGYEYWRDLRETPYYAAWIDAGVDFFFEKYGDSTLGEILDEVGVTREMMVDDALRFAPGVVSALNDNGVLERVVRRQLERFYLSDQALEVLS